MMRRWMVFMGILLGGLSQSVALPSVNGLFFDGFKAVDILIDSIDTPQPYAELTQIIGQDLPSIEMDKDGCSGGVSYAWKNFVYPILINNGFNPGANKEFKNFPIEACCHRHDLHYYRAFFQFEEESGAERMSLQPVVSRNHRKLADEEFLECLSLPANKEKLLAGLTAALVPTRLPDAISIPKKALLAHLTSQNIIAHSMYFGVRFGGRACSNHQYRWGNGYKKCENRGANTFDTSLGVVMDLISQFYN